MKDSTNSPSGCTDKASTALPLDEILLLAFAYGTLRGKQVCISLPLYAPEPDSSSVDALDLSMSPRPLAARS